MTNRTALLTEAARNRDAARAAYDAAEAKFTRTGKGRKAWFEAADELEFWVGKVTMLSNEKGW